MKRWETGWEKMGMKRWENMGKDGNEKMGNKYKMD